jgi:PTS system nitrogen regulatory IIA component
MNLLQAFKTECVKSGAKATGREEALRMIADLAAQAAPLKNISSEGIYDALLQREELGSTGFGGGIAIPHCRMSEVSEFVVGIVSFPEGVNFGALDEKPVRLMVFIVAPDTRSSEHIRILSKISQALNIPGAVEEMVREPTAQALEESFLRHVADEVDEEAPHDYNLFHVVIQDEDLFHDILQVFGSLEHGTTVILDAEHISKYMHKMPMFAGFWSDVPSHFSQMIVALVNKKMTNETIRRIERVTGKLSECTGVIVTVQELFYCAGSIAI